MGTQQHDTFENPDATFENVDAAAIRLGLPPKWLKAEAKAGRIPVLKVGNRLLFNLEQVEQALLEKAEVAK